MPTIPFPEQLEDQTEEQRLRAQFPKSQPPAPNLEMSELPEDVFYPDGPPRVVKVSLDKLKYTTRQEALERAHELCQLRNLRFTGMFETARYYVANCVDAKEPR